MFHRQSGSLENITLYLKDFYVCGALLQLYPSSKFKPAILVSKGLENLCME